MRDGTYVTLFLSRYDHALSLVHNDSFTATSFASGSPAPAWGSWDHLLVADTCVLYYCYTGFVVYEYGRVYYGIGFSLSFLCALLYLRGT